MCDCLYDIVRYQRSHFRRAHFPAVPLHELSPPISLVSLFISRDYHQVLPPFAVNSESIMVVLVKFQGVQLPSGQNSQNIYAPRGTPQHEKVAEQGMYLFHRWSSRLF